MARDMSKSLRVYTTRRVKNRELNTKEQELYDLAFHLYKTRRYGREYLRQLVTVACIDADEEERPDQ